MLCPSTTVEKERSTRETPATQNKMGDRPPIKTESNDVSASVLRQETNKLEFKNSRAAKGSVVKATVLNNPYGRKQPSP